MDLKDYRVQLPSTIQQQQRFALTLPFAWLETKYVSDQNFCYMIHIYFFLLEIPLYHEIIKAATREEKHLAVTRFIISDILHTHCKIRHSKKLNRSKPLHFLLSVTTENTQLLINNRKK